MLHEETIILHKATRSYNHFAHVNLRRMSFCVVIMHDSDLRSNFASLPRHLLALLLRLSLLLACNFALQLLLGHLRELLLQDQLFDLG